MKLSEKLDKLFDEMSDLDWLVWKEKGFDDKTEDIISELENLEAKYDYALYERTELLALVDAWQEATERCEKNET